MKRPHLKLNTPLFPKTLKFLNWLLGPLGELLTTIGFLVKDSSVMLNYIFKGHWGIKHTFASLAFVGIDALPVALMLTGVVGAVLAMQVAKDMVAQGGGNYVGALVALAMVRELGPVMTGFSVIAMAGSAFSAEITSMKGNSQIDALKVLQVNPVRFLILPRVVATIIALPILALLGTGLGIFAGMFTAHAIADVSHTAYIDSVRNFIKLKDVGVLLLKSICFGLLISTLCCSIGFTSSKITNESAKSVTKAVVWSFIGIALLDYIISYFFY